MPARPGTLGRRRWPLVAALVVALLAAVSGTAHARGDSLVPQSVAPPTQGKPPPGYAISARQATAIASTVPAARDARREHPNLRSTASIPTVGGERGTFEVLFYTPGQRSQFGTDIRVEVVVSGTTGYVLEVWTGPQAGTPLARGEEPSVGRSLNKPYVWLPLAVLFLLPFFDPRRPLRLLHLDLLVLLGFGLSQLYFNQGRLDVSVPLVYPLLAYLVVRMLIAGLRPREREERLIPRLPVRWMAVGLVLLVIFRVGLNLVDSNVIDVGYASVVGADRIAHGEELYVANDVHGDTYGPVNYLVYQPFELLFPWDGTWDSVHAAHAAAIAFDLLTIVGLMLLGSTLRPGRGGRELGLALAFAWAAYPFSLLALQENTNDLLVASLVVLALAALRSPPGRGALLALAGAAKFTPFALAPLLARGAGGWSARSAAVFAATCAAICAAVTIPFIPDGGLRELYDTTIGFQLSRGSPFSVWALHPSLEWLQTALKAAVAALVLLVAFVPRGREPRQVVALAAAVLAAVQLPATHWFYFYLVWTAPLVLATTMSAYRGPAETRTGLDGWTRTARSKD
ncbi:MAG TPA: glycosyltransferase 87 family protein [Thermoleophilaceae bacterium]|nr:glycosyltransferase 87 family protein [Thermoleophilaceae bacterium]